ncbi:MAG: Demethylmenaquinone methyltransferase, partial [uncultured Solirubrobacteraceae bacterium]
ERGAGLRPPGGPAGPGDVRPHRWRLRPHERGHDGRAAPPLALAGGRPRVGLRGRPGARRRDRHRRPGDRAAPARLRGRRQRLLRGDAGARPCEGAERDVGVGRRAGAAVRRRRVRRGDGRVRGAQLRRPRQGCRRDGAGREARRQGRRARDHDADEAAALDVLLAVVRPARPAARALRRRLHVPSRVGEALPGRPRARRRAPRRRTARRRLGDHRGRDHRHPSRNRQV